MYCNCLIQIAYFAKCLIVLTYLSIYLHSSNLIFVYDLLLHQEILDLNFWVYAEILFKITCLLCLLTLFLKSRKIHLLRLERLLTLITYVRRVHSLIQGRRSRGCERAFAPFLDFPWNRSNSFPFKMIALPHSLNPLPLPPSYGPVMLIEQNIKSAK